MARQWNWIRYILRIVSPEWFLQNGLRVEPVKRARPVLTWRKIALKKLEDQIKTLAHSRPRWRDYVRALCSKEVN